MYEPDKSQNYDFAHEITQIVRNRDETEYYLTGGEMDISRKVRDECIDTLIEGESALKKQVGGNHYKNYKGTQPYEFFLLNQIPHHKAAIIRRILRYDQPTGKGVEDLEKIAHEIELIVEIEGWQQETKERRRVSRKPEDIRRQLIKDRYDK